MIPASGVLLQDTRKAPMPGKTARIVTTQLIIATLLGLDFTKYTRIAPTITPSPPVGMAGREMGK